MTPVQKAVRDQVITVLNNCVNTSAEKLGYLRDRWQDEKEYEDFADYATEMKKLVPEGFEFVGANKRPFGFTISHPKVLKIDFQIFATAREVSWKAISK